MHSGGFIPWIWMWAHPRVTIRRVIQENPRYGIVYLATAYALQNLFYLANLFSFGLHFHPILIGIVALILAPGIGMLWLYYAGWVLHFTGRWLGGSAPMIHLRSLVAWSHVPMVLCAFMWLILWLVSSGTVFVLSTKGSSVVFINFVATTLGIWSFVLMISSIREVQGFSLLRSIANILLMGLVTVVFATTGVLAASLVAGLFF